MRSRLNSIHNWDQWAEISDFSAKELARRRNVSVRQLERFFRQTKNKSLREWLNELRQRKELQLVAAGCKVMDIAGQLGYKHPTHFSRAFKHRNGFSPTQLTQNSA